MGTYTIRPIRAHEWQEIRSLRLDALKDEDATMAFVETYDEGAAAPDDFWQKRAAGSSVDAGPGAGARQFVAVAEDGTWVGTSVVLVETAGEKDFEGEVIEESGGHVVGVFVRPGHRGIGLLEGLFDLCLEWMGERGLPRARLYVHEENVRAQGAYRKCGFAPTGKTVDGSLGREIEMARPV